MVTSKRKGIKEMANNPIDNKMKEKVLNPLKVIGITVPAVLLGVILLFSCIRIIPEGHIGVKYQLGAIVRSDLAAGAHIKAPFFQSIKSVDVREQVYETTTSAYTRDTQTVESIQVKLNYVYDSSQLSNIIRTIGIDNVESKLIVPQVNSVLKNAIGGFRAEELVQGRSALQEQVESELRRSLAKNGITVTAFNIEGIDFEDAFEQAVRLKVEAEQQALRAQNETVLKEEEAKQRVIAAEAEAESQRIAAEAEAYAIELIQKQLSSSPQYIQLQMVEKWNGEWPEVMGNTVNPFVSLNTAG